MKNLIIDGQVLQTSAWDRGMGKYTLQLMHELSEQAAGYQLFVVFNDNLDADQHRLDVVKYLCPNIEQLHATLPLPVEGSDKQAEYKRALNGLVSQRFAGQDNVFLITSLFTFDFCAYYPDGCRKLLLFYDLIPLLFWQDLGGFFPPHLYMSRFRQIYEADQIFAISQTTANDLADIFGIDPRIITNIDGGYSKITEQSKKPGSFAVPEKYVLFPSGDLPHKNNEVAAEGFGRFNAQAKHKYKLLVTSHFSEASRQKYTALSPDIIFTGNVSDEELNWLYSNADAVLFASKYEGLGIPILDAVANNKPVIASDIPVFREMSETDFYMFDSGDSQALATAFTKALASAKLPAAKLKNYTKLLAKYTWPHTASRLLGGLADSPVKSQPPRLNGKIALAGVHPGIASPAGRLMEPLWHMLSESIEVDCYFDDRGLKISQMERPSFLDYAGAKPLNIAKLTPAAYRQYDHVFYLIDSQALAGKAGRAAAVLPGALVYKLDSLPPAQETVWQVIKENSLGELGLPVGATAYEASHSAAEFIRRQCETQPGEPNFSQRVIRQNRLNSTIKKLLLSRPNT